MAISMQYLHFLGTNYMMFRINVLQDCVKNVTTARFRQGPWFNRYGPWLQLRLNASHHSQEDPNLAIILVYISD